MNIPLTPICILPQERHYDSFQNLLEDLIDFEKHRDIIKLPDSIRQDSFCGFEKVRMANSSEYLLLPASRDYGVLYRGQNRFYEKCLPTIFRDNPPEIQIWTDLIRIEEFSILIDSLDVTKFFKKHLFHIDYEGLAQHYGLRTRVLDFTSDPEIAFFFAMCDYRYGKYYPKYDDKEYVGYIYAVSTLAEVHGAMNLFVFSDNVRPIGLQPFKRPGLQKGYSYHSNENGLQYGYLYSFSYTMQDSIDIFNKYDKGNALWVNDGIDEYSEMILKSRCFSYQALSRAVRKYGLGRSVRQINKLLLHNGYRIVKSKNLKWARMLDFFSLTQRNEVLKQIGQRYYESDEIKYKCLDVKQIGEFLLLSLFDNPRIATPGYDSGFSVAVDAYTNILEMSTNHKYLTPSADGKIHPEWLDTLNNNK